MYETSSEEDGGNNRHSEDSGIGSSGRSEGVGRQQSPHKLNTGNTRIRSNNKNKSSKNKVEARVIEKRQQAAVDRASKDLVAEVVELSVCEVRQEEAHLGALCGGGGGEQQQIVLAAH